MAEPSRAPSAWCRRCDWQGDAITLVEELHQLGFLEACDFLARHAGIAEAGVTSSTAPPKPPANDNQGFAENIWNATIPVAGTIGETYLRRRGITIAIPPSIRFASRLWHKDSESEYPALVSAITSIDGSTNRGILRTYLRLDGRDKADILRSRKMLGDARGCSVHLAPAGRKLGVAEGIETALSLMQLSHLPVWAALSTAGLEGLQLPDLPLAAEVVIGADNDGNSAGLDSANKAAKRWTGEGREVRIALPPDDFGDWNDALREATR